MVGFFARFMKITSVILLSLALVFLLRMVVRIFLGPSRQVHDLLARYPAAEQTSVFLPSRPVSWRVWQEPRVVCATIDEMRRQGWTYLRSSRVQAGRLTLRGVTLHFIRTDGFKTSHAAWRSLDSMKGVRLLLGVLALAACMALGGCAGHRAEVRKQWWPTAGELRTRLARLQPGMTVDEVTEILGVTLLAGPIVGLAPAFYEFPGPYRPRNPTDRVNRPDYDLTLIFDRSHEVSLSAGALTFSGQAKMEPWPR